MDHKEAYDLIEPYVFGTLETEKVAQVDSHLDTGCAECVEHLRDVAELSTKLANTVPYHNPPEDLKDRLFERIGAGRGSHARGRPIVPWLSAAVGVAASVVLFMWTLSLRQEIDTLTADLAVSQATATAVEGDLAELRQETADVFLKDAIALLAKPCTRLLDLAGVAPNPQAFAKILLHPEETFGIIYVYKMPQTPEGMEYQLWMMRGDEAYSLTTFNVAEDGSAVLKMQSLPEPSTINEFKVTIEPRGGQTTPTGMLYLTGVNTVGTMH